MSLMCICRCLIVCHVKRRDGGWTPRPKPSPSNHMRPFGRKSYTRPWPGQRGSVATSYDYSAPRQNFGRGRPFGRGGRPGDFYSSYDDVPPGPDGYPDYLPYEYGEGGMPWPRNRQYDEHSSDEDSDYSSRGGRPKFSSQPMTVSTNSGDEQFLIYYQSKSKASC